MRVREKSRSPRAQHMHPTHLSPPTPARPVPTAKERIEPDHSGPVPPVSLPEPLHNDDDMKMKCGMILHQQEVMTHNITFLKTSMLHHMVHYYQFSRMTTSQEPTVKRLYPMMTPSVWMSKTGLTSRGKRVFS